jgi:hypothetical protein
MKRLAKLLGVLFAVGLFSSSCATVDRLNSEAEEETARIEKMTPQEKAAWEQEQHEEFMIDMKGYFGDADSD